MTDDSSLRVLVGESGEPPGEAELLSEVLILTSPSEESAPDSLVS